MNPLNIGTLNSAGIDICTLANNHILDWNDEGLIETITTLKSIGMQYFDAGENIIK
jgi:poly-gamma-glutamate capsule biosynthesis protein CapA/YwtB (metallophosphatase superfamily)